jgi:hypothetical protein
MPGKWRFFHLLPTGATVSGDPDRQMPLAIFLNNRPGTTQRCMIWLPTNTAESAQLERGVRFARMSQKLSLVPLSHVWQITSRIGLRPERPFLSAQAEGLGIGIDPENSALKGPFERVERPFQGRIPWRFALPRPSAWADRNGLSGRTQCRANGQDFFRFRGSPASAIPATQRFDITRSTSGGRAIKKSPTTRGTAFKHHPLLSRVSLM